MEPVGVLSWVYQTESLILIDMPRKWKLNNESCTAGVLVELRYGFRHMLS
jgi:hypothetical protein